MKRFILQFLAVPRDESEFEYETVDMVENYGKIRQTRRIHAEDYGNDVI